MDNFCHTLVGAACGEAGLKDRTRFATATLVLANNLPDIDALVFATDLPSVAFRRGLTHGVVAQALLPVALAGLMMLVDRIRPSRHETEARPVALLLLAYLGVLTHVGMDLLNNYGVRLLMPFSNRWFYGDSVFIIDLFLWITLGAGIYLAWQRGVRPARVALGLAAAYIAVLVVSSQAARAIVLDDWRTQRGRDPQRLMVGPIPITPVARMIIADAGDHYRTGVFIWFPREIRFNPELVPKNDRHPAAIAAAATDPNIQAVLVWARFPYYEIDETPQGTVVTLRDVRFGDAVGAVATRITKRSPRRSRSSRRSPCRSRCR